MTDNLAAKTLREELTEREIDTELARGVKLPKIESCEQQIRGFRWHARCLIADFRAKYPCEASAPPEELRDYLDRLENVSRIIDRYTEEKRASSHSSKQHDTADKL